MQVNHTPSPSLTQENRFPWYLSLALFTLVACGSIGIGIYSYILDQDMLSNRVSIADVEKKIQMMSTDKDIIITRILQSNTIRPSLDINGLIKEFQRVAVASNVRLSGFNVSNDTITTALTATE